MTGSHDASASALGYLYQTRWALLRLLQQMGTRPDQSITLELHDDVAWEEGGRPTELLQLKHHTNGVGSLSDKSVDLWKSLKVWMDEPVLRDAQGPILSLVTTARAPHGSAASMLKREPRDPLSAIALLNTAAASSSSEDTQPARETWLALPHDIRMGMVERILIQDGEIGIESIDDAVRSELIAALPLGQEETYLGLIWRWWDAISVQLLRRTLRSISAIEVRQQLNFIRNQFLPTSLPTLIELDDVDGEAIAEVHDAHCFVHQLRWVRVGTVHLRKAIVDYYRAVEQSAKWIDRDLVGLDELQTFEDNLVDEWESAFADMMDEIGDNVDSKTQEQAGKLLFKRLRDSTAVSIRIHYTDPFFARGKRHELADRKAIGWHPQFEERLRLLTLERG